MISFSQFFSFYQEQFLPAYLRMKDILQEGERLPPQIEEGITDSFTYLSHCCDSDSKPEDQAISFSLAFDALINATCSCYAMVFILIDSEISAILEDPLLETKYCINMNYSDFKKEHARFKTAGHEAKKLLKVKSNTSSKAAITAYEEAIEIGDKLLDNFDSIKIEDCRKEKKRAEKLAVAQRELLSTKNKMIDQLMKQISNHPKRSIAAIVVLFIVSGILNAIIKNFWDQILFPHALRYLSDNLVILTIFHH